MARTPRIGEAAQWTPFSGRTLWSGRRTGKGSQGQRRDGRFIYSIAEIDAFNEPELEGSAAIKAERAPDSRPTESRLSRPRGRK
ncbi:hypothetical protein OHT57_12640 [Streptomyces sp. NBC_00285]|uniref:hypothetical protein n=1 Tax=Streptomyces sp. NBC_00285 TaxID=2975700 RepID=UPI002E27BB13|nr:hypothetical protein [Streptomyces sp. NBC_00285]